MAFLSVTGVVLALAGGLSFLFAELLTRPPRKPLPKLTPADVGLPFESVTFASHDGLKLVGWLVGPRLSQPPVLLLHGYTDNKASYLSQARFLFDHGFPCLIYDHREHGESSPARVSLGPLEARDVLEALAMLKQSGRGERFVAWGVSMGAATALLAAARSQAIAGVIAESSYERLDQIVADTVRLRFRLPRLPMVPMSLAVASLRIGMNLFRISIAKAVERLGSRPLLLVSGEDDPRMTPELGRRLLSRAQGPAEHLVIAGAAHAQCWSLGQPLYGEHVLKLLDAARVGKIAQA